LRLEIHQFEWLPNSKPSLLSFFLIRKPGTRHQHFAAGIGVTLTLKPDSLQAMPARQQEMVATPRPLAPACGRQRPHLRGFLSQSCAARESCLQSPVTLGFLGHPFVISPGQGCPASAVYVS